MIEIILIQKGDEFPGRNAQRRLPRRRWSAVSLLNNALQSPVIKPFDYFQRAILRSIVDDDQFKIVNVVDIGIFRDCLLKDIHKDHRDTLKAVLVLGD